ncbi:MAG: GxxExxY protein [Verrucomicrobiota bacterium]
MVTTEHTKTTEAENFLFKEETYQIRGAVFEVYKVMGSGFLEAVYHECLERQFEEVGIAYSSKQLLNLYFKKKPLLQTYQPDFICFNEIIVEIKAVKELMDEHRAQILNYLKATNKKVGLLVNFGHYPKTQIERFVL